MKPTILIAGGSGLIGKRLVEYLSEDFHFHILSRSKRSNSKNVTYFLWNTEDRTMDLAALDKVSVVINLSGAGIADRRWTKARKEVLLNSRLDSVSTLTAGIKESGLIPPLYIAASAIGYYGHGGAEMKTETNSAGSGFLADLTVKWEEAQRSMQKLINRTVMLRIGIVLSKKGGALKEMLKTTAFGVYGYFGNGEAYYSWIHIDDICKMVKKAKSGLGLVLPVPTFALKLALGEMTQMLTDSMRVAPRRLLDEGYSFEFTDPVIAIKDILKRDL